MTDNQIQNLIDSGKQIDALAELLATKLEGKIGHCKHFTDDQAAWMRSFFRYGRIVLIALAAQTVDYFIRRITGGG